MGRILALLGLAAATMAASPPSGSFNSGLVYQEATIAPMTGTAPAEPPAEGYTPAPVPDADQAAPVQRQLGPPQAELTPGIFTAQSTYRGEGYTPGSSIEGTENRNVKPAPGFSLNVPLQ
jgi:hypothetical protein